MPIFFRKSINLGLLRINLSKKGIGYSVGFKGYRSGVDANGNKYRSVTLSGTGITSKEFLGKGYKTEGKIIEVRTSRSFVVLTIISLCFLWKANHSVQKEQYEYFQALLGLNFFFCFYSMFYGIRTILRNRTMRKHLNEEQNQKENEMQHTEEAA